MMSMETTTTALRTSNVGVSETNGDMDRAQLSPVNTPDSMRLSTFGSSERVLVRTCFSANPKLRLLRTGSTHKRFDSGDWCMERLGLHCKDEVPLEVSVDQLSPKLCPEPMDIAVRRAPSVLQHSRSEFDSSLL